MRLGFAVAIHVDPDVLLVDEVLAVGDEGFTHKCLDKFAEFRRRGKTILLVTHSLGLVERFCDEALWLDEGRAQGARRSTARRRRVSDGCRKERRGTAGDDDGQSGRGARSATPRNRRPPRGRHRCDGETAVPVTAKPDGELKNMFRPSRAAGDRARSRSPTSPCSIEAQQPAFVFHSGDPMSIRLKVRGPRAGDRFRVRHQPVQRRRRLLLRHEHLHRGDGSRRASTGDAEVTFAIDSLDLVEGTYKLDVAVHKCDGYPYDYHRLLYTFRVKSRTPDVGIYRPRHHWAFSGGVRFKEGPSRYGPVRGPLSRTARILRASVFSCSRNARRSP